MLKSLHIDPGKCTGCLQCEMACSFENTGVFNPSKSRIKVFKFHEEGRFVPYTCTQCDEAWCMRACPVDAISVDKATGAKMVSDALCVGCKVCTIACPFGTISYTVDSGKVIKCDLCGGSPACVGECNFGALVFKEADKVVRKLRGQQMKQRQADGRPDQKRRNLASVVLKEAVRVPRTVNYMG